MCDSPTATLSLCRLISLVFDILSGGAAWSVLQLKHWWEAGNGGAWWLLDDSVWLRQRGRLLMNRQSRSTPGRHVYVWRCGPSVD
jgi:hypothetical protein